MLFKLFTLLSMFALAQSTSVRDIGPSHVSTRHRHGGYNGYYNSGGNNWLGLLGTTATVTVTETQTCKATKTTKPTSTSTSNSGSDSKDLDSPEHCLYIFNQFRKSVNLPPFKMATQEQINCADKAAAYDARAGYHASFYAGMCPGASAQCECLPTVGFGIKDSIPGDPLQNCINAYIAEYTQGLYPGENLGHYKIITNPNFKSVACGTDDKGFYTHNFYV